MRKAYSYINLLVYISLFLLLFGLVISVFFPLLNKSFLKYQDLKEQTEINRVIDAIVEDITYAQAVQIIGEVLVFKQAGVNYEYLLKNQRISRKKESYIYLTDKNIFIKEFLPKLINSRQIMLKIKTEKLEIVRLINRAN